METWTVCVSPPAAIVVGDIVRETSYPVENGAPSTSEFGLPPARLLKLRHPFPASDACGAVPTGNKTSGVKVCELRSTEIDGEGSTFAVVLHIDANQVSGPATAEPAPTESTSAGSLAVL